MFQSALIRRHASGENLVDAGMIAETLLFYKKVHVVAEGGLLADLLRVVGPDNLVGLLEDKYISMTYSRSMPAVLTNTMNSISRHSFTAIRVTANKDGKRINTDDEVSRIVDTHMGKSRKSKNTTKALLSVFKFRRIGPQTPTDASEVAKQALDDPIHTTQVARSLLSLMAPNYAIPADFFFKVAFSDESNFYVLTNLDYEAANNIYHQTVSPAHSSLDAAYLLSFILNANIDMDMSSYYSSELVVSNETSAIIRLKVRRMLERREKSTRDIEIFQEVHLKEARAVREAINSGERNFSDFIPVLHKASRFKEWLSERNPDANLLDDYYKAATAGSWIGGLPAKSLRYILTGTIGLAGLLPGLAASAADEFLIDRLVKGWRPNQFVDGPLKRFTAID